MAIGLITLAAALGLLAPRPLPAHKPAAPNPRARAITLRDSVLGRELAEVKQELEASRLQASEVAETESRLASRVLASAYEAVAFALLATFTWRQYRVKRAAEESRARRDAEAAAEAAQQRAATEQATAMRAETLAAAAKAYEAAEARATAARAAAEAAKAEVAARRRLEAAQERIIARATANLAAARLASDLDAATVRLLPELVEQKLAARSRQRDGRKRALLALRAEARRREPSRPWTVVWAQGLRAAVRWAGGAAGALRGRRDSGTGRT